MNAPGNEWDDISDEAMDFGLEPPSRDRPAPAARAAGRAKSTNKAGGGYHSSYYERNRRRLAERAAARWRLNEGGYRDKGLARARQKRSQRRAARADEKFRTQVSNFRAGWECKSCFHREEASRPPGKCPACNAEGNMARVILVTVALCDTCERTLPWEGTERPCGVDPHGDGNICPGTMVEGEKVLATKPPRFDAGEWVYSSGTLAAFCGKSPSTIRTWIEHRVIPGYSRHISGRYWFTQEFMEAVAEGYRKTLFVDGRAPHKKLRRWVKDELAARGVPYEPFPPR